MLQNRQSQRNIKSFRAGRDIAKGLTRPEGERRAFERVTVRLSSGISANILDFRAPQKHVLEDMTAMGTGRKAGGGQIQTN